MNNKLHKCKKFILCPLFVEYIFLRHPVCIYSGGWWHRSIIHPTAPLNNNNKHHPLLHNNQLEGCFLLKRKRPLLNSYSIFNRNVCHYQLAWEWFHFHVSLITPTIAVLIWKLIDTKVKVSWSILFRNDTPNRSSNCET